MRYVLEDIEVGNLSGEVRRRGISERQRVRVVLDTLDDALPLAQIAEEGGSFAFLAEEPELYSLSDIRPERYPSAISFSHDFPSRIYRASKCVLRL